LPDFCDRNYHHFSLPEKKFRRLNDNNKHINVFVKVLGFEIKWYTFCMNDEQMKSIIALFEARPEVKLVYFFGSRATGTEGPLSDYDFAVYADEKDAIKIFDLKLAFMGELSCVFKTDDIDVVMLNTAQKPELKFNIINEGKLIFEREPFRALVEPRIVNEHADFMYLLKKYNLTKAYA